MLLSVLNVNAAGIAIHSNTNAFSSANGIWTTRSGLYTFTPSSDSANIIYIDILNRLLRVEGFTSRSVPIVTVCTRTSTPAGNVTVSSPITATVFNSTVFTINASGIITDNSAVNLTATATANITVTANRIVGAASSTPTVYSSTPMINIGQIT